MVGRGLVFCVVLVDDDDDDYNGGDADRLITLTVTGCPLLRIGEKAMMLSHSDHHYKEDDKGAVIIF